MAKKTTNNKKRPITTRRGKAATVSKNSYIKDLERLEKVNEKLLQYKGTELYMETCQTAYDILRKVNELNYEL